jgi:hypothetical protein
MILILSFLQSVIIRVASHGQSLNINCDLNHPRLIPVEYCRIRRLNRMYRQKHTNRIKVKLTKNVSFLSWSSHTTTTEDPLFFLFFFLIYDLLNLLYIYFAYLLIKYN